MRESTVPTYVPTIVPVQICCMDSTHQACPDRYVVRHAQPNRAARRSARRT